MHFVTSHSIRYQALLCSVTSWIEAILQPLGSLPSLSLSLIPRPKPR